MSDQKAIKVNVIVDARIEIDWPTSGDTPDRWAVDAERTASIINDELFGIHGGWRGFRAGAVVDREDQCSVCDGRWEVERDDDGLFCASCGARIEDKDEMPDA